MVLFIRHDIGENFAFCRCEVFGYPITYYSVCDDIENWIYTL